MNPIGSIALGVLLAATTCSPATAYAEPAVSLHHLLTDKDCEAVPELLGDWTTDGDLSGTWTLQELRDHNYRLISQRGESDTSNKAAFDICVAHLGGYLFFDATFQKLLPDGKKTVLGDDDNLFWIPLHLIGRLDIEDDALHFRLLDDDWVKDSLKSENIKLTCSQDDEGQYLLTAPSKELKQFATRFATDPNVFSYAEDFERAPREEAIHRHPHSSPRTGGYGGAVLGRGKHTGNAEAETGRKGNFHKRGGVSVPPRTG